MKLVTQPIIYNWGSLQNAKLTHSSGFLGICQVTLVSPKITNIQGAGRKTGMESVIQMVSLVWAHTHIRSCTVYIANLRLVDIPIDTKRLKD